jgi:hypothetical protein
LGTGEFRQILVNHGLITAALYYVHAGFDGIGLVELSEVFEAGEMRTRSELSPTVVVKTLLLTNSGFTRP